jgi:hypothetical protein
MASTCGWESIIFTRIYVGLFIPIFLFAYFLLEHILVYKVYQIMEFSSWTSEVC